MLKQTIGSENVSESQMKEYQAARRQIEEKLK